MFSQKTLENLLILVDAFEKISDSFLVPLPQLLGNELP